MGFIQEQGGLINMLLGRTPQKRANSALDALIPTLDSESNASAIAKAEALRGSYPRKALDGLVSSTSSSAQSQREIDQLRAQLLKAQTGSAELGLEREQSDYVSPTAQSQIDVNNARIAGMNAPPSAYDQEMNRLKLLEQQQKLENQNSQAAKRERDAGLAQKELIDKSITGAFEADSALSNIDTLLTDDSYKRIYGTGDNYIPTILPGAVTLEAQRDQVVSLLGLESRQKLKGQGTITDSEAQQLAASATILGTAGISEGAAKAELQRVRGVFERAKERSLSNPEAFKRYYEETGISELYRKVQAEQVSLNDLSANERIQIGKYIRGKRNGVE